MLTFSGESAVKVITQCIIHCSDGECKDIRHKKLHKKECCLMFTDSVGVVGGGGCFFFTNGLLELELLIEVTTGACSLPLSPVLLLS